MTRETRRPASKSPRTAEGLLGLYRPDLATLLEGHPAYRKRQVIEYLCRPQVAPFSEATTLPADLRVSLDESGASTLQVMESRRSADGTEKLLLACGDGARIETVVMPYRKRTTVCVSSQAGCPVGCGFCATGAAGLRRNLSGAEIVDQVRYAMAASAAMEARVSNIVYMGMGEPLLNLQAVLTSLEILTAPAGMGIGHRSISVSTVGIPAGILRLAREQPQVNLALSLHAATDEVRDLLIPARHRHPLKDILAAAWQHFELTHRKLLVEYLLLQGINDSVQDARRLAALLRGHVVTVNLLGWNPVNISSRGVEAKKDAAQKKVSRSTPADARVRRRERGPKTFAPSSRVAVMAFKEALAAKGIEVTVRASRGADIEGACGQLAGRVAPQHGEAHRP